MVYFSPVPPFSAASIWTKPVGIVWVLTLRNVVIPLQVSDNLLICQRIIRFIFDERVVLESDCDNFIFVPIQVCLYVDQLNYHFLECLFLANRLIQWLEYFVAELVRSLRPVDYYL